MRSFFSNIKDKLKTRNEDFDEDAAEEYVELDTDSSQHHKRTKILVRPYVLEDFSDVKPIIDSIREGYTICLVNIRPLKGKDVVELKRAVNKMKKTCDAVSGDVAGFGEDWIVLTPGFAEIYRAKKHVPKGEKTEMIDDESSSNTVLEQYDTDDVF